MKTMKLSVVLKKLIIHLNSRKLNIIVANELYGSSNVGKNDQDGQKMRGSKDFWRDKLLYLQSYIMENDNSNNNNNNNKFQKLNRLQKSVH